MERRRINWKRVVQALVIIAAGLGAYRYVSAPQGVKYAIVKTVITTETLGATGKVRGERVADLGLDVSGLVRRIDVKEGQFVLKGALLLSVDKSDLIGRVDAAQAALRSAEAELARASRGPLPSEIRCARAELDQAKSVGGARMAQAEAKLRVLKSGTRRQEIAAAEAELQSRSDLLAKAELDLQRTDKLVKQGALSQSALDEARTNVKTARSAADAQKDRISLMKAGPTSDEVEAASAAVAEARASRDTSVSAARERLNALLALPRQEDVKAARAKVDEARVELQRATDLLSKADLTAPFDGAVADILVEKGQSMSPGQKLISFHEMSKPIIEVETDEENLANLAIGQRAVVSADAYPGREFQAIVTDLGALVNPERGTIDVTLRPVGSVNWARPDLTVDVNIVTKTHVKRVILPPDTVTKLEGGSAVLVIRDRVALPVRVKTGAVGPEGVVVTGKLKDGEMVARDAANVEPRSVVQPVTDG